MSGGLSLNEARLVFRYCPKFEKDRTDYHANLKRLVCCFHCPIPEPDCAVAWFICIDIQDESSHSYFCFERVVKLRANVIIMRVKPSCLIFPFKKFPWMICWVLLMRHGTYALYTCLRRVRRQRYEREVQEWTNIFVECSRRILEGSTGSEGERNTKDL